MNSAKELQEKFGITTIVNVADSAPGYPVIEIDNQLATASIALHGAHVMRFKPRGHESVLWLSDDALFEQGKAIRGGIPICWPWFGGHPQGGFPAHGFVRNRFWNLYAVEQMEDGATRVVLGTSDDETARSLWPHAFELQLTVLVGGELSLSLQMTNRGAEPMVITSALHSYFSVGNISKVHISGLEGVEYIDQLQSNSRFTEDKTICFDGELDRIYQATAVEQTIHDAALNRIIRVEKTGSQSTVVWNPWIDKSASMADFEEGGYRRMVCVEVCNASDDVIRLDPHGSHVLGTVISVTKTA